MTKKKAPGKRPNWTAEGDPKKKGDRCFVHASGCVVRHCGHPTAIRPWFLEDPFGNWIGKLARMTRKRRPMGLTFRTASAAIDWLDDRLVPFVAIPLDDELDPKKITRGWSLVLRPDDLPLEALEDLEAFGRELEGGA